MAKKNKAEQNPAQESGSFVEGASGSMVPALEDPMGKYDVNTSAEKVYKRNTAIRITAIILALLLLLVGIGFGCVSVLNYGGRFTVSVKGNLYGIQIADNPKFNNPTLQLRGSAIEAMDNITKEWILNKGGELNFTDRNGEKHEDPVYETFEDIDKVYGDHNGTNYLAYTFAVRNGGVAAKGEDATVDFTASLEIVSAYKGADQAIRAAVFVNGKPTIYAAPKKGTSNELEDFAADKVFFSDDIIMKESFKQFKVGDAMRFTVVVWLEGEDPECINEIMGGDVKLKMNLEVTSESSADGT